MIELCGGVSYAETVQSIKHEQQTSHEDDDDETKNEALPNFPAIKTIVATSCRKFI